MPFTHISESLKETVDRLDGFKTGRLFVENEQVGLYEENGQEIILDDSYSIEVRNDNEYIPITVQDVLEQKTPEDWHLYAGLYARVKQVQMGGVDYFGTEILKGDDVVIDPSNGEVILEVNLEDYLIEVKKFVFTKAT